MSKLKIKRNKEIAKIKREVRRMRLPSRLPRGSPENMLRATVFILSASATAEGIDDKEYQARLERLNKALKEYIDAIKKSSAKENRSPGGESNLPDGPGDRSDA